MADPGGAVIRIGAASACRRGWFEYLTSRSRSPSRCNNGGARRHLRRSCRYRAGDQHCRFSATSRAACSTPAGRGDGLRHDPANFGEFFVNSASYDGTVYGMPLCSAARARPQYRHVRRGWPHRAAQDHMADFDAYAESWPTQRDAGAGFVTGVEPRSAALVGGGLTAESSPSTGRRSMAAS